MIEPDEINAKDEMNKAIAVLKARIEYIINSTTLVENFPEEELNALSFTKCSLERWRDDDVTNFIPEVSRQLIWFKQVEQIKE
jgi:hypothetical protein